MDFQKNLSRPEARHRYWHIHKDDQSFFPEPNVEFKVDFDGKTFDLKLNHKFDVMTGKLYERYRFLEGDRIILKKKSANHFVLSAPDTQLYPAAG